MKILIYTVTYIAFFAGGLCIALGMNYPTSSQTRLQTASGATLGYIDAESGGYQAVRDPSKRVIGYINDRGTYDTSKKRILRSNLPGYLFCK
jgi:hypothetical protein